MATYTRNIGRNRGRPRLWLEKAILTDNGFNHGDRFNVTNEPDRMVLQVDDLGARKVAGKPDRPVIDMAGAVLERSFNCDKVQAVTIRKLKAGRLEITPA